MERRAFVLELAGNETFLEEVLLLQSYAQQLVNELGEVLGRPRRQCARLHFLTNRELMGLLAQPTPEYLNLLVGKVRLNRSSCYRIKIMDSFLSPFRVGGIISR